MNDSNDNNAAQQQSASAGDVARLSTELAEVRARLQTYIDAMPQAYVPRVEDQARREGQDKLLAAMDAKLDKLIEKSDDLSPVVATNTKRIEILETELARIRTAITGALSSAILAVLAVVLQLIFSHKP